MEGIRSSFKKCPAWCNPLGFALFEILVVIAKIAIVAGKLMPALAKARREMQQANCISNVKQCGLVSVVNKNDNRDTFPYLGNRCLTKPIIDLLRLQNPYISINNRACYRCATDRGAGWDFQFALRSTVNFLQTDQVPFPCTYYYNDSALGGKPRRVSEARNPVVKAVQVCFASGKLGILFETDIKPLMDSLHVKEMNLLFADGHAEFAKSLRMIPQTDGSSFGPNKCGNNHLTAQELGELT